MLPFSSEYTDSPVCKGWRYKNAHRMKEAKHIYVYGNSFSRLSLSASTVARNKVYRTTYSLACGIIFYREKVRLKIFLDFFITNNK